MIIKRCSSCKDFIHCQTFLEECEQEQIDKLEDERQSEAFYETYLNEKKYEHLEEKENYLEQLRKEKDEE